MLLVLVTSQSSVQLESVLPGMYYCEYCIILSFNYCCNILFFSIMDCPCASSTERRCPPGICVSFTVAECPVVNVCDQDTAPLRCPNGECVADYSDCTSCPDNMYRCESGKCIYVRNDTTDAGIALLCNTECSMVRCPGTYKCVEKLSLCECAEFYKKCDSGLCVPEDQDCTSRCPTDAPVLCPTGVCVRSILACPCLDGYKCADGSCVKNKTDCQTYCVNNTCGWTNPCADGEMLCSDRKTCVAKADVADKCPGITCAADLYACDSGICVRDADSCPKTTLCPDERPLRCANSLTCVVDLKNCPIVPTCPADAPKLCQDRVTCSPVDGSACADIDQELSDPAYCSDAALPVRCANSLKCVQNIKVFSS